MLKIEGEVDHDFSYGCECDLCEWYKNQRKKQQPPWDTTDKVIAFVVLPVIAVCTFGMFCKGIETIIAIWQWIGH